MSRDGHPEVAVSWTQPENTPSTEPTGLQADTLAVCRQLKYQSTN